MKDLSRSCIFDGNTDNLNTTMEVALDGERYKVAVCEGCEDEASPGAIKKLIPNRLIEIEHEKAEMRSKMEMFKELAEEMGFVLVKKEDLDQAKDSTPTHKPRPADPNALADKPTVQMGNANFKIQKNTRQDQAEEGMSSEEAVAAMEAAKRAAHYSQGSESAAPGDAATFIGHQIPKQITINTKNGEQVYDRPQRGVQKMQTVKGAAGLPTAIPKNIQGADGETTITIVDTGGDKTIQERGRQLAQMRQYGDGSSYSKPCRPCQGTGLHARRQCKACGGVGIII